VPAPLPPNLLFLDNPPQKVPREAVQPFESDEPLTPCRCARDLAHHPNLGDSSYDWTPIRPKTLDEG
jgi:hypothetical protein